LRKHQQLEIWGKAQHESARHPKSDWGKIQAGEIPPVAKSRELNSNALAYAERAMPTNGGSTCMLTIFLLMDQSRGHA